MKTQTKIIAYLLIFGLIIQSQFFGYTFAASSENSCPACNSTPNEMQMFINFEVEMLGILRGENEKEQVGTNRNSWLFNGGALSLPNAFYESTMSKIKTDFDSEFKAVRAESIAAVLLWKMAKAGLRDAEGSIEILFKDESKVRDYKTLQELDMSINDLIRDMGMNGIWKDQVAPSVQRELINVQLKYSKTYGGTYPIFDRLSISQSVKNRQIMEFLLELNAMMKSMLFAIGENTPMVDSRISYLEEEYSYGNITVEINEDYKKSIIDAYSCAKNSICNESFKNSLKEITTIRGKTMESASNSWTTIKNSLKNLKAAAGSFGSYDGVGGWIAKKQKPDGMGLTDRQIELLHTVYGIDAYELNTSQLETRKQNLAQITKEIEPLTSILSTGENTPELTVDIPETVSKWEFAKEAIIVLITQPRKPLADGFVRLFGIGEQEENKLANRLSEEEKRDRLNTIFWQETTPPSDKNKLWANTMQVTIDKILVDKSKDKEYVMIGQNSDTHYFVEIGAYIHSTIKEVVGNKDTEGLIKHLGEACTYQCSNHGTANCYAK